MKLNEKQKVILTSGVFVVVLGVVGGLVYMKYSERTNLEKDLQRYQRDEQTAREKRKRIPKLVEQRAQLVRQIERYTEILPPEEDVQHDAFVRVMDDYRKDTKILIKTAEYVPVRQDAREKDAQSFVRHRYRFSLVGTVPDVLDFVAKIENHKRFLKVDALNIHPYGMKGDISEGDLGDRNDAELLEAASKELKEIDLTVSTYTYVKGTGRT